MQLTEFEKTTIKSIYNDWHNGATTAEEALFDLEILINGNYENEGDN